MFNLLQYVYVCMIMEDCLAFCRFLGTLLTMTETKNSRPSWRYSFDFFWPGILELCVSKAERWLQTNIVIVIGWCIHIPGEFELRRFLCKLFVNAICICRVAESPRSSMLWFIHWWQFLCHQWLNHLLLDWIITFLCPVHSLEFSCFLRWDSSYCS